MEKVKKADAEILGTPVNPDELDLLYKAGAVGVHDLYEFFGLSISYEKADKLWGDFSQDVRYVSHDTFPENIFLDKERTTLLFMELYLYEQKMLKNYEDEENFLEVIPLVIKKICS